MERIPTRSARRKIEQAVIEGAGIAFSMREENDESMKNLKETKEFSRQNQGKMRKLDGSR
jgi:hypothetical protein